MIKYTDQELEQLAQTTFEQFPNTNEVYATSDGNIFLSENLANLHATSKGRVLRITSKKNDVLLSSTELTAAEIVAVLEQATTLQEIIPYQFDKRATVKTAVEKAFEKLANVQKNETEDNLSTSVDLVQQEGAPKNQE